ncbi:MAG: glycosyltransferase family 1 protein [Vicinamibacterales bacterium]
MRVGIYIDVALDDRPTGIGRHVIALVQALAQLDTTNEYLLYFPSGSGTVPDTYRHFPTQANVRPRPVRFPRAWVTERPRIWWNWALPWALRRDRIDVFHGPNHFAPDFDRARTVVTIHDLAYFHMTVHGEQMDAAMREWTRHALEHAQHVIALSKNTQVDIEKLGVTPDRIRVIYGGGNILAPEAIPVSRTAEMRRDMQLPDKYVLFVGAVQPRKNVPFLVRAFAELLKTRDLPHHLVLAGPKESATAEIVSLAQELGLKDRVHLTGYVADWQLPLLYREADLFVLPTRYEGFTLVTLEAMAYGTPLIATDSSSIREGVGDAGLLIPVDDVEALAGAMGRALTDTALRADLIAKGQAQAAKFTWDNCAKQTLQLYTDIGRR